MRIDTQEDLLAAALRIAEREKATNLGGSEKMILACAFLALYRKMTEEA